MNRYISISTDFLSHRKTSKLRKCLGDKAIFSLIRLWSYVAQWFCKGILTDFDKEMIEDVAGWRGEEGRFVDSILEIGFLDKHGDQYQIHDWKIHNKFAYNADTRSEHGRKAAKIRWARQRQQEDAQSKANCTPSPN